MIHERRHSVAENLIDKDEPVLGICNSAQALLNGMVFLRLPIGMPGKNDCSVADAERGVFLPRFVLITEDSMQNADVNRWYRTCGIKKSRSLL